MGMREYPMFGCIIAESKMKELGGVEYDIFINMLKVFGVHIEDFARAIEYEDDSLFYDEVDFESASASLVMTEAEIEEKGFSIVNKAYTALTEEAARRANLDWIGLKYVSNDAGVDFNYLWIVPLKLSRPLRDLGVYIESWTEWG